ncbi:MAG TPA: DUF4388 domain-containing protein [Acidimicrobiales bacterium]|jgi:hypothetical protein|nr:DUF4388 domain-containing protein [Acidimicrobiales bacterium]
MPLSGTFDVLDFAEVLRLLGRQQLTGRLHVRSRSYGANLFLEDGLLVGADQSEHQAAAATGDVRGRLEEICFELLDAERGSFEFQAGRPGTIPAPSHLKVDGVLTRARRRLEEWRQLQVAIPSLDLQPRLVVDLERTEVTLDRERWRMLTAIDGRRNLRAIGRTLNLADFDVCRIIKALLDDGILELDGRAATAALASLGPDADTPPVTETVTTVNGKQALKVTAPAQPGESPAKVTVRSDTPADATPGAASATAPGEWPASALGGRPAGAEAGSPGDSDEAGIDADDDAPLKEGEADADPSNDDSRGRRRRVVRIRSRLPRSESG